MDFLPSTTSGQLDFTKSFRVMISTPSFFIKIIIMWSAETVRMDHLKRKTLLGCLLIDIGYLALCIHEKTNQEDQEQTIIL